MVPAATTVGGYLQSLPNDRRVAMARVCSMIRRAARGVRESMRYGLAFYELDGPLFAVESQEKSLTLFFAEKDVVIEHQNALPHLDSSRCAVTFSDMNCLPLDQVEKLVRASLMKRRERGTPNPLSQEDLLKMWGIKEEDLAVAPPIVRINIADDEEAESGTK